MAYTGSDKERARARAYYHKNKNRINKRAKEYRKKDRAKEDSTQRRYAREHPERNRRSTREYNRKIRNELLNVLGGKCVRCGFSDSRALQIDHINGGGTRSVKKLTGMKNMAILREIRAGSVSYQILCANCNWIKRHENKETGNLHYLQRLDNKV